MDNEEVEFLLEGLQGKIDYDTLICDVFSNI